MENKVISKLAQEAFKLIAKVAVNSPKDLDIDIQLNEVLNVLSSIKNIADKTDDTVIKSDKYILIEQIVEGDYTTIVKTVRGFNTMETIGICEDTRVQMLTKLSDARAEYERRKDG